MRKANVFVLAAGVAVVVACQAEDGPRYRDGDGRFSMTELEGWTQSHERDAVVFYAADGEGAERSSIAIRSVARGENGVTDGSPSSVTTATKTAIQGLPGATIESQVSIATRGMSGMSFELTFEPRRANGQRYARTHVVLVGKRRVFHLLHTGPEGTLGETAQAFEQVVESFREEA